MSAEVADRLRYPIYTGGTIGILGLAVLGPAELRERTRTYRTMEPVCGPARA